MTRLRTALVGGLVVAIGLGASAVPAMAQPGDFDPGYADCGLGSSTVSSGRPWATAIQPDGQVVEVGSSGTNLAVYRFKTSGALDKRKTFGLLGFGVTSLLGRDVLVLPAPESKIVVLLNTPSPTPAASTVLRVVRFNPDLTLDTSFGNSPAPTGTFEATIDGGSYTAERIVRQDTTGKLVVLLRKADGTSKLVRLEANGSAFDATFVPAAQVSTPTEPWVIGTDGAAILLAGSNAGSDPATYTLLRLTENGALDAGFPVTGSFGTLVGPDPFAVPAAIAARPDHSILIGGSLGNESSDPGPSELAFSRHVANGAPDLSFNNPAGSIKIPFSGRATLQSMAVIGDGSIVGVGTSVEGNRSFPAFVRITNAGLLASGTFGKFTVDIGVSQGFVNRPAGIVATTDGKKVLTGMLVRERGGQSFFASLALRLDDTALGAGYVLQPNGALRSIKPSGAIAPACVFDNPTSSAGVFRGIALARDHSGYVVDKSGNLRRFTAGVLPRIGGARGGPSWPGADVARGVGLAKRGTYNGGYVVDMFGFLHSFGVGSVSKKPPAARGGPAFASDAARGVAIMPSGRSGYVLDLFGGLHPFGIGSNAIAPATHGGPIFTSDAARGVAILPDSSGGYVIDLFGGLHPFGIGGNAAPSVKPIASLTPGQDRARGLAFVSTTGMTSSGGPLRAAAAGGGVPGDAPEGPRRVIAPPTP